MENKENKPQEGSEAESPRALLVLAQKATDPYVAPFVGRAHLAQCFVIQPLDGSSPKLGYFTPMEREEAASSGLDLLTPEDLDMTRWARGALPDEHWADVLSRALHLCELAPGPLAVAGSMSAGWLHGCLQRLASEGWSFVPGEPYVNEIRKTKSAVDLEDLRQIGKAQGEAFGWIAKTLREAESNKEGFLLSQGRELTVGRLRRRVALIFAENGLEQPAGNIIAPGEEGAVPHNTGTDDRVLKRGESLIVDLFPKGRLFGDCTRTFCVGQPSDSFLEGFEAVRRALRWSEQNARPGVAGWDLQKGVCELLDQAGYPTPITSPGTLRGYVHGLGHGVGFDIHELPSFRDELPPERGDLAEGDVITLEPGLYEPEQGWGIRLENLYWVGTDGVENLTDFSEEWNPAAW